jgi:L-lactate utilization protein LutB
MPPRTISQLDLANLKADITEEQMRIRHEQRTEFATKLLIVDNLSVEQKLTNQTIQVMQKTLDTHQEYTKSEFQDLRKEMRESNKEILSRLDKMVA